MSVKRLFVTVIGLAVLWTAAQGTPGQSSRLFLLFIDLGHNSLAGVEMSRSAALHFLGSEVRAGDEVAFLTYSEFRGLRVREEPTTDHDRVRKAIRGLIEIMGTGGDEADWTTPLRSHNFLEEMDGFAEVLGEAPGTKNIIFFTSGFPVCAYQSDWRFRELYDGMGRKFRDARAPVFVVNALGHRADWQGIEEKADFVLQKLADASGGRYFRDIARYKTIVQEIGKAAGF
jgi:hypothetical protein